MGVFDDIEIHCPRCGRLEIAQSKSGPCELNLYDLKSAPEEVLWDANRHAPYHCYEPSCGTHFVVEDRKTVETDDPCHFCGGPATGPLASSWRWALSTHSSAAAGGDKK